jgi:glutamate-5-semialdehyde dehydrogenase
MNEYILKLGQNAKKASKELLTIDTRIKNRALREIARALIERKEEIKLANQKDIENGKETGTFFCTS